VLNETREGEFTILYDDDVVEAAAAARGERRKGGTHVGAFFGELFNPRRTAARNANEVVTRG